MNELSFTGTTSFQLDRLVNVIFTFFPIPFIHRINQMQSHYRYIIQISYTMEQIAFGTTVRNQPNKQTNKQKKPAEISN